uniref:Protein-S-isoprenylcysteine O-methyltransferase n=2 Tax=Timema TaxID=61471 RepID=A0A7R9ILM2_9NEOP|nr:unnamed protein product [Timema bartmani]CAD7460502.1 unnamed protein product [Timema tahoe]
MTINYGKISVCFFLAGCLVYLILLLPSCGVNLHLYEYFGVGLLYYSLLNIIFWTCLRGFVLQIAICSTFLGICNAVGVMLLCFSTLPWNIFGCYIFYLSFFHYSEFLAVALNKPDSVTVDSFLLNHSFEYGAAAFASWAEFLIEQWLFPGLKQYYHVSMVGAAICTGGEVLRKLAMFTARTNFNHLVKSEYEEGHRLVTNGVYAWFRHPSYVGWFYWSLGTQLILLNPLCFLVYTVISWRFFHDRVWIEEITLLKFFGEDYYRYQQQVGTGLPFIRGYEINPP